MRVCGCKNASLPSVRRIVRARGWVKFQTKTANVRRAFVDKLDFCYEGEGILLKSGAKAYPQGGGWWVISGYHPNGLDTLAAFDAVFPSILSGSES